MKKLLIVCETYYPDSRATIRITQRIAEELCKKGIEIYAVPLKRFAADKKYPKEHSGVLILSTEDYADSLQKNVRLNSIKKIKDMVLKLLYAEKHFMMKEPENAPLAEKWNRLIQKLRDYQRTCWYTPVLEYAQNAENALLISQILREKQIDSILSVSLPFWLHTVSQKVVKLNSEKNIKWVPVCFDPYGYDQTINRKIQSIRIKEEHKVFKDAQKVLMLSQSREDYQDNDLLDRIYFFNIPNVRKIESQYAPTHVQFDKRHINCVFTGNLYWAIRNPQSMFELFSQFADERIKLHVIGSLSFGFPENYIAEWSSKLGDRLTFHERVSAEESISIMNAADVLINIGNTTTNQCPSKVLEYISIGKPILSISKIPNCTSEQYLKKYPLALCVSEADLKKSDVVQKVQEFIMDNYMREVNFFDIEKIYSDCTTKKAVDTVLDAFC